MITKKNINQIIGKLALLSIFLFFPSGALANEVIPDLFGPGAPVYLSFRTTGLVFIAIVLIETVVLCCGSKIKWWKCLIAVLVANLYSSFLGVFASATGFSLMLLMVILTVTAICWLTKTAHIKWFIALVAGFLPAICFIVYMKLSFDYITEIWPIYASLLLGLILSVVLELPILISITKEKKLFKYCLLANLTTYILLGICTPFFIHSALEKPGLSDPNLFSRARSYAQADKPEKALETIRMMQEINQKKPDDRRTYSYMWELRAAKALAEKGYTNEAQQIIERIKNIESSHSDWNDSINDLLKEIATILLNNNEDQTEKKTEPENGESTR